MVRGARVSPIWVAVSVFTVAATYAVTAAAVLFSSSPAGLRTAPMTAVGLVGALLLVVALFWLWRLIDPGPGSSLLVLAQAAGLIAFSLPFIAIATTYPLGSGTAALLFAVFAGVTSWVLEPVAWILLVVGLKEARLVPGWAGALGIAGAVLLTAARLMGGPLRVAWPAVAAAGALVEAAFLVVLGVALLRWRGPGAESESGMG
jgi:hypothetical protein